MTKDILSTRAALAIARHNEATAPPYQGQESIIEIIDTLTRMIDNSPEMQFLAKIDSIKNKFD